MILIWALLWNVGTYGMMLRENSQVHKHEGEISKHIVGADHPVVVLKVL